MPRRGVARVDTMEPAKNKVFMEKSSLPLTPWAHVYQDSGAWPASRLPAESISRCGFLNAWFLYSYLVVLLEGSVWQK